MVACGKVSKISFYDYSLSSICAFVPQTFSTKEKHFQKHLYSLASSTAQTLECWIHKAGCKPAPSSETVFPMISPLFGWFAFSSHNWFFVLVFVVFSFHIAADICKYEYLFWSYIEADICEPILVSNSDMEPIVEHQLGNVLLKMKSKQGYLEAWVHSDTLHELCDLYFCYVSCGSCIQFYWYYNSNPKLLI